VKQLCDLQDKLRWELQQDFSGIRIDNIQNLPVAARIQIEPQLPVGPQQLGVIDLSCRVKSGAVFRRMLPNGNGSAYTVY
jgi:hypothetical protein